MRKENILETISDIFKRFETVKGNVIIERTEKDPKAEGFRPFVSIDKDIIKDTSLSVDARFLLIYLLDKPAEEWTINNYAIKNLTGWSLKYISKLFADLESSGYGKRYQFRNPDTGKLSPVYYLISELKYLVENQEQQPKPLENKESYRNPLCGGSEGRTSDSDRHNNNKNKINNNEKENNNNVAGKKNQEPEKKETDNKSVVVDNELLEKEKEFFNEMQNYNITPESGLKLVNKFTFEMVKLCFYKTLEKLKAGANIETVYGYMLGWLKKGGVKENKKPTGITPEREKAEQYKNQYRALFSCLLMSGIDVKASGEFGVNRDETTKALLKKYDFIMNDSFSDDSYKADFRKLLIKIDNLVSYDELKFLFESRLSNTIEPSAAKYITPENVVKFLNYYEKTVGVAV
jgi:hypothetical protein